MLTETDYLIMLREKAPPGMEPVVRALKRNPSVDNPFAVAWSMYDESGEAVCPVCGEKLPDGEPHGHMESFPLSAASALLRGKKEAGAGRVARRHLHEAVSVISLHDAPPASEGRAPEGPVVRVILITEGMGNMRDKNYYGPEAIRSAPPMFEGAVCMLNHPSYSEERDRPEGEVERTVGYYKGVKAETVQTKEGPRLGLTGELHFDLSPDGMAAYQKAKTAVHFSQEFPALDKEYVGLSVNAFGESEPRTMTVGGEEIEVNYVKEFVEVRSCDMVTIPARGGKIVALVESITGARENKEVRTMIVKSLVKARKALAEAQNEKDPDLRQKKLTEAQKILQATEAELVKAGVLVKGKEGMGKEDEDEAEDGENAEDAEKREDGEGTERNGEDGDGENGGEKDEDDMDGGDGDTHTTVTHKVMKRTGKPAMKSESDREVHSLAVKALLKESGLSEKLFDMGELLAMPFREAKKEIQRTKRISEANVAAILKSIGSDVSAGHLAKFSEGGDDKKGASANNELFADCTQ